MTIIPMISLWIYTYIYAYIITLKIIFTFSYIAICIDNFPCVFLLFINDKILKLLYDLDYNHSSINHYISNQDDWNKLLLEWI